ncbi:MAG: serine/threonine-protein phosphatase [Aquificae bacterium]|nr:serine/threonine-protein phosphatase [Aquificota bacterium]
MILSYCYATDEGPRPRNEDALLVPEGVHQGRVPPACRTLESGYALFAVADGMGGHPCGDRASYLVLELLSRFRVTSPSELRLFLTKAKELLDAFAQEQPHCWALGTALAGCTLTGGRALCFNVGDCRVYLYRAGTLQLVTRDHTAVFELFEQGLIDYETLRVHPQRNLLTSSLTGGVPETPKAFLRVFRLLEGDELLVCSDGLWEVFALNELKSVLESGSLREKAELLYRTARERSSDNFSFVLVEVSAL